MRRNVVLAIVLTAAASLAGCGGSSPQPPATETPATHGSAAQPEDNAERVARRATAAAEAAEMRLRTHIAKTPAPNEEEARLRVRLCGTGVFLVLQHIGRLPTDEEGLSILFEPPADEPSRARWRGPYVESQWLTDPWQRPIEFIRSATSPCGYDVRSLGADGVPGNDDILALDEPKLREAFEKAAQEMNLGR